MVLYRVIFNFMCVSKFTLVVHSLIIQCSLFHESFLIREDRVNEWLLVSLLHYEAVALCGVIALLIV